MRMNAYYYAFSKTESHAIDKILSAVACAGKAYHHTESWQDDCDPYELEHRGPCPEAWIQNAAFDAAEEILELRRRLDHLRHLLDSLQIPDGRTAWMRLAAHSPVIREWFTDEGKAK